MEARQISAFPIFVLLALGMSRCVLTTTGPDAGAGAPPHDAGAPPQDAGAPPEDAGVPPEDAGTDTVQFTWTIDSNPASSYCPPSSAVKIETTAGPTSVMGTTPVACTDGVANVTDLQAGYYTFRATLQTTEMTPSTLAVVDNVAVSVPTLSAVPLNFVVADADAGAEADAGAVAELDAGSLVLHWTVKGGEKCPVDGGTVNFSGQRDIDPVPTPADASVDCTAYAYTFTDLPPGIWTFFWTLISPENNDVVNAVNAIAVPEGDSVDAGFDISPCDYCMP